MGYLNSNISGVLPIALGIGIVVTSIVVYKLYFAPKKDADKSKKGKKLVLLEDPQKKYSIPLIQKTIISHDTRNYRFGLPMKNQVLGLPVGQHIHITAKIGDELVIRSYTPVSSDDDHGYVDLVIKVYFKNVHPKFPDGGKLTQYMDALKIGDTIDIRGPSGRLQYIAPGTFSIKTSRKDPPTIIKATHVNMIAGGVGITPLLQLIRQITKDSSDNTKCALLFANQTEEDILLRNELEDVEKQFPDQFKLWYTLDRPNDGWKYSSGFINDVMVRDHLFPPSNQTINLMCGPPPMINFACTPNLEKVGHVKDMLFAY